jgi:hypothetical protein
MTERPDRVELRHDQVDVGLPSPDALTFWRQVLLACR